MKKIFHNIVLISVLTACTSVHTEGAKEIRKGEDTVAKVHVEVSGGEMNERKMKNNNLRFEAHGTEPGWFIQISDSKLRLLADYGTDSVIIEDSFENMKPQTDFNYNKNTGPDKLELRIKNNPCTDAGSGEQLTQTVSVTWKGKSYNGCGKFLN
jgi:uncharacterized membrane protein